MADTLTAQISLSIAIHKVKDLDVRDIKDNVAEVWELKLNSGTGAGNCDVYVVDTRSLTASATEDVDLAGTFLQEPFGANVTFANIKFLAIRNNSTTQTFTVGGASATQFSAWAGAATDKVNIPPQTAANKGGWVVLICNPAGYTVGAGATDLLKVANSSGSTGTYDLIIIGASA